MPLQDPTETLAADERESLLSRPSARNARRRSAPSAGPMLWIWLLVPVALLALNWPTLFSQYHPISPGAAADTPAPGPANSVKNTGVDRFQQLSQAEAPSSPRPLSECMAAGTVIDDDVLRCRFGEVPRPKPGAAPAQGMVSPAYLAQYKAERDARPSGATARPTYPEMHEITGWDGKGNYLAQWQVSDNQVEYSSVCLEYGRGSIAYRECRKGAKHWVRNKCQQANHQGSDSDNAARQRYCSAASGFNPMG